MKVICAGFPKTGTKSMAMALRQLGYGPVHDFEEHLEYNLDNYLDFLEGRVDGSIFKSIYKDVDAVMDMPAVDVWYILHQQFPDAKVILMVRDNENEWLNSYYGMLLYFCTNFGVSYFWGKARHYLSRTRNKLNRLHKFNLIFSTGADNATDVKYKLHHLLSPEQWKSQYVKHNAAVKSIVPGENLLVFNVKEGWEPLCSFLGVQVPDIPFPFENKLGQKGNIVEKFHKFTVIERAEAEERMSMIGLLCLPALLLSFAFLKYKS